LRTGILPIMSDLIAGKPPFRLLLAVLTLFVLSALPTASLHAQATLPPMAANASPSFEVATLKPSDPSGPAYKRFLISGGRRLSTTNTTLNDLIAWGYVLHAKQIIGGPAWAATDKYDLQAEQDGQGLPSTQQWKGMVQKLLADRFKLAFHPDKREIPVYVLTVAKTGPKLTKSKGDPNGLPGLLVRPMGELDLSNGTITSLAELLQRSVLDRPVVDQTGLAGKYDITLKWTPADAQPGADAPPDLYTAIQEQLGLRLVAAQALDEVFVIDHVERPSEN
jgi:uncharacterized protein (TIGR03435 family)